MPSNLLTIAMVHAPTAFLDIIDTMRQYNSAPKRIQFIYPKMIEAICLWLAIKDGSADAVENPSNSSVHKENGDYTMEIFWDLLEKRLKVSPNDDSKG